MILGSRPGILAQKRLGTQPHGPIEPLGRPFSSRQTSPAAESKAFYSNAKMRFQSFFMLITVQLLAFASSISDWSNVPTLVSGNPPAGP
jgi:hypothetical protein